MLLKALINSLILYPNPKPSQSIVAVLFFSELLVCQTVGQAYMCITDCKFLKKLITLLKYAQFNHSMEL